MALSFWLASRFTIHTTHRHILFVLYLRGFGMGLTFAPLNLFSLGFPINMLVGLVCFATLLYNLPDHYLHLANFVLQQLDALKGHYGG